MDAAKCPRSGRTHCVAQHTAACLCSHWTLTSWCMIGGRHACCSQSASVLLGIYVGHQCSAGLWPKRASFWQCVNALRAPKHAALPVRANLHKGLLPTPTDALQAFSRAERTSEAIAREHVSLSVSLAAQSRGYRTMSRLPAFAIRPPMRHFAMLAEAPRLHVSCNWRI